MLNTRLRNVVMFLQIVLQFNKQINLEIMNKNNVVERIENWWSANSVSKYSQLSVSMSTNNEITLRFGYWLPINLFDLKKVIGNDYSVSGHDISDGDKNEAVFYKVKKL